MTTTNKKAADATNVNGQDTHTNGTDFHTTDPAVKGVSTQVAGLELANHPLPTSPEKRTALAAILKANPGTSSVVQCTRIRTALSQFSITTFEAMRYLDCYDARARVVQLRKAGERIDTHWRTIITESGDRHRVGLYVLKGGAS